MEIKLEEGLVEALLLCPEDFQLAFRKIYQQLKIVDKPLEVKVISKYKTDRYKIYIWSSRISLTVSKKKAVIGMFLYNEHLKSED